MAEHSFPSVPGVYTLVIGLAEATTLHIGGLGVQRFPVGFYTYTGSARGRKSMNLKNRIRRYLVEGGKKHWHIDYLLGSDAFRLRAVVFVETSLDVECAISRELAALEEAEIIVRGFGASDCRGGCPSHLCFFPKTNYEELTEKVASPFRKVGTPKILPFWQRV